MIDLPLSAVLGLESGPNKDDTLTDERVNGVKAWLKDVVREIPGPHLLGEVPAMVRALAHALATPVSEIGLNLWNKRAEIQKYADDSANPPTETHIVELYEHDLKQTLKSRIDIRLDGKTLGSVTLKATATVTVKAAKLVIRGGYITHVRLGELIGKAVLGVEQPDVLAKLKLKEVKSEPWKLDQEIMLPRGGVKIPAARSSPEAG